VVDIGFIGKEFEEVSRPYLAENALNNGFCGSEIGASEKRIKSQDSPGPVNP